MVTLQVVTLIEAKWSCYRGGQFREGEWSYYVGGQYNVGRMIMLQRWIVSWRENGHVTKIVTNGGRMVMLQKWSPMEGQWSCYRGGQFNGERMVIFLKKIFQDLFIGPQEFVVGYSKAPKQPQSSARLICHSHSMTRTGCTGARAHALRQPREMTHVRWSV